MPLDLDNQKTALQSVVDTFKYVPHAFNQYVEENNLSGFSIIWNRLLKVEYDRQVQANLYHTDLLSGNEVFVSSIVLNEVT